MRCGGDSNAPAASSASRDSGRERIAKTAVGRSIANLGHSVWIARGKFFVLILGKVPATMFDDLVERHRVQRLRRDRLVLVLHHRREPGRIGRGQTSKLEC